MKHEVEREVKQESKHSVKDAVWITWEVQRRNESMSASLGVELQVFLYSGSRLARYIVLCWRTLCFLVQKSPTLIFAQNPSLVLCLLVVLYGFFWRVDVVIDAHNAAFEPPIGLGWTTKMFAWCWYVIVTNAHLAKKVEALGGQAIVLPDPLPMLENSEITLQLNTSVTNVLLVCTWANDEPYMEVIEAAKTLGGSFHVYITGNYKKRLELNSMLLSSNTTLLGFVDRQQYDAYLQSVDIVVDLTTREHCLVCGAYEAIAAQRMLLLSDTLALREYFGELAFYTDNTPSDIKEKLLLMKRKQDEYCLAQKALKAHLVEKWFFMRSKLIAKLRVRV